MDDDEFTKPDTIPPNVRARVHPFFQREIDSGNMTFNDYARFMEIRRFQSWLGSVTLPVGLSAAVYGRFYRRPRWTWRRTAGITVMATVTAQIFTAIIIGNKLVRLRESLDNKDGLFGALGRFKAEQARHEQQGTPPNGELGQEVPAEAQVHGSTFANSDDDATSKFSGDGDHPSNRSAWDKLRRSHRNETNHEGPTDTSINDGWNVHNHPSPWSAEKRRQQTAEAENKSGFSEK